MIDAIAEIDSALAKDLEARADRLDLDLLERAYRFGAQAHRGQKRLSGEDYISHSVAVARILTDHQMDTVTIAAALLHDVVEDADVTIGDVQDQFGPEAAAIVDGLTKISSLHFRSNTEKQVENYRKLLLSIASDARVIIVKLADRLHNMRTLEFLAEDKQRRIARETREIYAPLAHRFGMASIKAELEDLCFKFLEPEAHATLLSQITERRGAREETLERLRGPLQEAIQSAKIESYEITGRTKHLWSIYRKMTYRNRPLEEIYDLMAVRVLVRSVPDCYHVLGVVHSRWTPLQERIKDYIASPKSNGYQSLHTTVFGPSGELYEIQIRTIEMHQTAEYGIAAHWLYKEKGKPSKLDQHLGWFRQLLELQQDAHTPEEFLEFLKIDLYQDEIFVFTPQGDVKRLPTGATPIDFAFAVHTEIGFRCQGARVNGRIAPLHRPLKNGDTVEVLVGAQARPSRDWLNHVHTARARHRVRHWIKQEETDKSTVLGREIVARELRRRRLMLPDAADLKKIATHLGVADDNGLFQGVGRGDIPMGAFLRMAFPEKTHDELPVVKPNVFGRVLDRLRVGKGVRIQGVDGLLVRYAQCCQPVPGDAVLGFVTQGKGISIHRRDCPNLLSLPDEPHRRVEIDWQQMEGEVYEVCLAIVGEDRRGLYGDILQAVSGSGTNVRRADLSSRDGEMFGTVFVEVENSSHLAKVIRAIRRIRGVGTVERREPVTAPTR